jgi:hypothetical protein
MLLLIALSFEVASFDSSNVRDFMKGLSHEILQGLKDIFIDRPSYKGYAGWVFEILFGHHLLIHRKPVYKIQL